MTPQRRKSRFGKRHIGYGVHTPQLVHSGDDDELSERGKWLWSIGLILLIGIFAVLIVLSR